MTTLALGVHGTLHWSSLWHRRSNRRTAYGFLKEDVNELLPPQSNCYIMYKISLLERLCKSNMKSPRTTARSSSTDLFASSSSLATMLMTKQRLFAKAPKNLWPQGLRFIFYRWINILLGVQVVRKKIISMRLLHTAGDHTRTRCGDHQNTGVAILLGVRVAGSEPKKKI